MRNRYEKLKKLATITSVVQQALTPINSKKITLLGSLGPGVTLSQAQNDLAPDGTLNIYLYIRGANPGMIQESAKQGLAPDNGVILTAAAVPQTEEEKRQNIGSALLAKQFGAARIKQLVNDVVAKVKQKYPNRIINPVLHIGGFSGGVANGVGAIIRAQKDPNYFGAKLQSVTMNDGLHVNPERVPELLEFAKKAASDPNVKLTILHTAVVPAGSYPSTTQTAQSIIKNLGLTQVPYHGPEIRGIKPTHIAKKNGLTILTLYDKPTPYYVDNRKGSMGDQHVEAAKIGLDYFLGHQEHLSKQ